MNSSVLTLRPIFFKNPKVRVFPMPIMTVSIFNDLSSSIIMVLVAAMLGRVFYLLLANSSGASRQAQFNYNETVMQALRKIPDVHAVQILHIGDGWITLNTADNPKLSKLLNWHKFVAENKGKYGVAVMQEEYMVAHFDDAISCLKDNGWLVIVTLPDRNGNCAIKSIVDLGRALNEDRSHYS